MRSSDIHEDWDIMNKEVPFYEKKDGFVQCRMCPHYCRIKPLYTGICRAAESLLVHFMPQIMGLCVSTMDPIEKSRFIISTPDLSFCL